MNNLGPQILNETDGPGGGLGGGGGEAQTTSRESGAGQHAQFGVLGTQLLLAPLLLGDGGEHGTRGKAAVWV